MGLFFVIYFNKNTLPKIFYITKSLTGLAGGLLRKKQIELFEQNGFKVETIIIANHDNYKGLGLFKYKLSIKISLFLQYVGIFEDYLDPWVQKNYKKYSRFISKNDILFSTGSGELGCYKLAYLLSLKFGCKHYANLHDPITYSYINGKRFLTPLFHVKRDKYEFKYLSKCEYIITSCKTYSTNLMKKYPFLSQKIIHSHFGYIKKSHQVAEIATNKIKIVYAGTFDKVQSPQILLQIAKKFQNVEIHYIGNYSNYKPLRNIFIPNVIFHGYLTHDDFLTLMLNMNIAFVSLCGDCYENCFPSKIFEYLNLGLPIFGVLPNGDAKDFVNNGKYGYVISEFNSESIIDAFYNMSINNDINIYRKNIKNDRDLFYMGNQFKTIINLLNE